MSEKYYSPSPWWMPARSLRLRRLYCSRQGRPPTRAKQSFLLMKRKSMASKTTKMPTADRKPTASGVTGEGVDTQITSDQRYRSWVVIYWANDIFYSRTLNQTFLHFEIFFSYLVIYLSRFLLFNILTHPGIKPLVTKMTQKTLWFHSS